MNFELREAGVNLRTLFKKIDVDNSLTIDYNEFRYMF